MKIIQCNDLENKKIDEKSDNKDMRETGQEQTGHNEPSTGPSDNSQKKNGKTDN